MNVPANLRVLAAAANLGTDEARKSLNRLVRQFRDKTRASDSLMDDAIRIGPHRRGGAVLIPEVDVEAHGRRELELEQRVLELEEEIEALQIAHIIGERSASPAEDYISFSELARGVGHPELADDDV